MALLKGKKRKTAASFDPAQGVQLEGQIDKFESKGLEGDKKEKWQPRYFRLYQDIICWFKKDSDAAPSALIPLQTVIYVVHLEKAKKQDEVADLRRWNMVVKGDPDTWTFELRCHSKEDAAKWVSKVQELSKRAQNAQQKRKATKVNIEYDLKGKFWKNVMNLTLVRDRITEADQTSADSVASVAEKMQNQHKLLKKGVLKKKSPKLGLWQTRDVELYGDVLVYREKNKEDSSGAVPIWDIVDVKVEGKEKKTQFVFVVKSSEEKTRTFFFETASEEAAAEWVAEINKAIQSAARASDSAEDKTARLITSAEREIENHDYDMAVQILKEAVQHNPDNQSIKDKLQEARKLARKKFQESINPEARRLKLEGNDWFNHKNYLKARECYDKAIELDSNNSLLYFNRSAANHFLGDPESAEADARKAVDLDAESVDAHTRLGLSLLKMKKYEASREAYETALKLDPTDGRAIKGMTHLEKEERKALAAKEPQTPTRSKSIDSNPLDDSQRGFGIKVPPLDVGDEEKSPLPPELLPSIRPSSPSLYPESPRSNRFDASPSRGERISSYDGESQSPSPAPHSPSQHSPLPASPRDLQASPPASPQKPEQQPDQQPLQQQPDQPPQQQPDQPPAQQQPDQPPAQQQPDQPPQQQPDQPLAQQQPDQPPAQQQPDQPLAQQQPDQPLAQQQPDQPPAQEQPAAAEVPVMEHSSSPSVSLLRDSKAPEAGVSDPSPEAPNKEDPAAAPAVGVAPESGPEAPKGVSVGDPVAVPAAEKAPSTAADPPSSDSMEQN